MKFYVSEIFGPTFQGEGPSVGRHCHFLRLAYCNQHCIWCFGIGEHVPRIKTAVYGEKPIDQIEIGEILLTFNENKKHGRDPKYAETRVREVVVREVMEWYEVSISGKLYHVTPEHPFFTLRGLVEAENLEVGDYILSNPVRPDKYVNSIKFVSDRKGLKVYNFSCSPYSTYLIDNMWVHNCDTSFTWRFSDKFPHNSDIVYDREKEVKEMTEEEIIGNLLSLNPSMLVVSGGEPMLQAHNLFLMLLELKRLSLNLGRIEVETAGTVWNEELCLWDNVHFNVSPKLENSNNPKKLRYQPDILRKFEYINRAIFKFVVCNDEDFQEIQDIVEEVEIPDHKVYIMIEGITQEDQEEGMKKFLPKVLEKNWNLTPRLHIQLFGNRRGV